MCIRAKMINFVTKRINQIDKLEFSEYDYNQKIRGTRHGICYEYLE